MAGLKLRLFIATLEEKARKLGISLGRERVEMFISKANRRVVHNLL